jgi:hypothetical protein
MLNNSDFIIDRLAKTIYVILLRDAKGKLTLLADPGLNRPWSSKNKKLADFHASQCDGEARTYGEAFELLRKEHPDLEKTLTARIAHAAKQQTLARLPRPEKPKPFLDSNANPLY